MFSVTGYKVSLSVIVSLLKKVSVLEGQQHVALCLLSADVRALLKYIDIFENGILQSLPVF